MRLGQLARRPWCQCPHHKGQKVPANVVDHIIPHRGDTRLFYDSSNLQSMTKRCHDSMKQSQEKGGHGFNVGSNVDGTPINPDHPWYK